MVKSPIFQMGFELEFVSFMNPEHIRQRLLKMRYDIPEIGSGRGNYKRWYLTTDRSIENHSGTDYVGLELISPILRATTCLREMRKVFNFLKANNCETNSTCGFHIGLSYQDKAYTMGIYAPAVVLNVGEQRWLDLWGRKGNQYCKSQYDSMITNIARNRATMEGFDWASLSRYIRMDDKYQSINFLKLQKKNPYIEFRIIGGADYHQRYRDILKTVKAFMRSMKISHDYKSLTKEHRSQIISDSIPAIAKYRTTKKGSKADYKAMPVPVPIPYGDVDGDPDYDIHEDSPDESSRDPARYPVPGGELNYRPLRRLRAQEEEIQDNDNNIIQTEEVLAASDLVGRIRQHPQWSVPLGLVNIVNQPVESIQIDPELDPEGADLANRLMETEDFMPSFRR